MIQDLIKKYEEKLKLVSESSDRMKPVGNDVEGALFTKGHCLGRKHEIQCALKYLRELEGRVSESEIDAAALEYAQKASSAPDKETPEWVCTDFKAGVNWVKHAFENSNPLQR